MQIHYKKQKQKTSLILMKCKKKTLISYGSFRLLFFLNKLYKIMVHFIESVWS